MNDYIGTVFPLGLKCTVLIAPVGVLLGSISKANYE
jgi:hypothetical protein